MDLNPYQPPQAELKDTRGPNRQGWRAVAITSLLIATAAYHLFVVFLYSSPPDRTIALWFLVNSPLLLGWIVTLVHGRMNTVWFGLAVEAVLLVISAAIIITEGNFLAVVTILGTICFVFGIVTLLCHVARPVKY